MPNFVLANIPDDSCLLMEAYPDCEIAVK